MLEYYSPGFDPIKTKILQVTTAYTMALTDSIVEVALTIPAAVTVTAPNFAGTVGGRIYSITDGKGVAGTYNITIIPFTAGQLIGGSSSYVINSNNGSVSFYYDGTNLIVVGGGGGGGGTPGGSSGQVQYNSSGAFAGSSSITVNADGTLNATPEVVAVTGTTKTLAITDANTIQDCSNALAQTITIPLNSSVPFPTNTYITFEQNGAGGVTVQAATGVTINGNSGGSVSISGQYTAFYIRKETSPNTWYAEGVTTGGGITALTGDVTASGSGSVAATVAKIAGVAVGTPTGTGNVVFSASPTLTGTANIVNATVTGKLYLNGGVAEEAVFSNGNSGTSLAVNLDNGNLQSVTITGAVAITQTTPTHPGKYTLVITQDASGHVYSLSGIKWAGGTAPTYSTAANKIDVISIIYDGTNYYGMGGVAFA